MLSDLDAAKFKKVKEELGKHFATQSWSDGADAAMAFETLTEPHYDEPAEPEPPKRVAGEDAVDLELKVITYKMAATKNAKANDDWSKCLKNWKNTVRACLQLSYSTVLWTWCNSSQKTYVVR